MMMSAKAATANNSSADRVGIARAYRPALLRHADSVTTSKSRTLANGVPGSLVGDGSLMPSPHVILASFAFLAALGVTLLAAALFADRLDRVGTRLGFAEALLGVLTALAADGPELASSIAAIVRGERDVGLGVVLGSNAF